MLVLVPTHHGNTGNGSLPPAKQPVRLARVGSQSPQLLPMPLHGEHELPPGMLVSTTGAHFFKRQGGWTGSDQPRRVKRKAANVELQFDINAWYTTTSTSHSTHLSGTSRVTSLVFVRDLRPVNRSLIIEGTCIGICGALDSTSSWDSRQFGGIAVEENEDADDWSFDSVDGDSP